MKTIPASEYRVDHLNGVDPSSPMHRGRHFDVKVRQGEEWGLTD